MKEDKQSKAIKQVKKNSFPFVLSFEDSFQTGNIQIPHDKKWIVLYFYPKDNTPGCSIQAKDFTSLKAEFDNLNVLIIGVSRDSIQSHQKFITKFSINYPLILDETETLCHNFGVIGPKKFMGREYIGIDRSTFIIKPDGLIIATWRSVKTKNHAKIVLEKLKELKA